MKAMNEEICSSYKGRVEEIFVDESSYVYEWEELMTIRKNDGTLEKVAVGVSGHIQSINIEVGQEIDVNTLLLTVEDDLLITGCE
ncbi:hypothetical protein H9I32_04170 [Bacillus sp. Xin]|uniref:hypothetical protein n=1 Tax=unclassified Bacillus (in: firmicutes) TaxID=185979 RepID=UPI001573B5A7|nr:MULTISPECIES: hypothetical protein [unclassified Bacillus (in: firmicutes)]MBC6971648.1 hypothetical protein [Bacillus sp. Xin]NSW39052.1 hypothetical protein [Bacillus sp. Xin1]